jgi:hypothetical protein
VIGLTRSVANSAEVPHALIMKNLRVAFASPEQSYRALAPYQVSRAVKKTSMSRLPPYALRRTSHPNPGKRFRAALALLEVGEVGEGRWFRVDDRGRLVEITRERFKLRNR